MKTTPFRKRIYNQFKTTIIAKPRQSPHIKRISRNLFGQGN